MRLNAVTQRQAVGRLLVIVIPTACLLCGSSPMQGESSSKCLLRLDFGAVTGPESMESPLFINALIGVCTKIIALGLD